MQKPFKLDSSTLDILFLEALNYPMYAQPEFYILEQKKSGWSKGVFLQALLDTWGSFEIKLRLETSRTEHLLAKENKKLPENFGLNLETETNGEIKGTLTRQSLKQLRFSIAQAYKIGLKRNVFDSYQILALCERTLTFIKGQFDEQKQKTIHAKFLADKLKERNFKYSENPEYIIYYFSITTDAPICDFPVFKNEIRKLLLTSQNLGELRSMLLPLSNLAVKVVEIYNKELHLIEFPQKNLSHSVRDERNYVSDNEFLQFWHDADEEFISYNRTTTRHFDNRDFAVFAANIANLISKEVLKKGGQKMIAKEEEITNFDKLFDDPEITQQCYKLLIDENIIDDNFNYRGKLKSFFCVWIRKLDQARLIGHKPDSIFNDLINKKIKGLDLTLAMWRKSAKKATDLYNTRFHSPISQLSRYSQKRK
ncbi:MAG TPA: hypothetical protein VHN59_12450 [Chitinophagaceae bacterium]|nr:hypothetical protein [Chitinophagaceae bacterium]